MEFSQIRYFLAATETLNFTRAAERCHVSQPALTRSIKNLEEELGGLLFVRERNRTHLTDLGKVMRVHLSQVEVSSQDAVIAARNLLSLEKAPLNIGVLCTLGPARTVAFLSQFQLRHPGIELSLHDVKPNSVSELLLSGDLDCALLGLPLAMHERFDSILLYEEPMVAAFAPDHRFAAMRVVPLHELARESYLDRLNCEFRSAFYSLLGERQLEIAVRYRSEREDWLQNMVLQGMGVCMIPEYSITVKELEYRPISDPELTRSVELITVAGRRQSPAVKAFLKAIIAHRWSG